MLRCAFEQITSGIPLKEHHRKKGHLVNQDTEFHLYIKLDMWQSQVEIEHYSIVYFNCAGAFQVLKRTTSIKGRAHTCYVDLSGIHASSLCI